MAPEEEEEASAGVGPRPPESAPQPASLDQALGADGGTSGERSRKRTKAGGPEDGKWRFTASPSRGCSPLRRPCRALSAVHSPCG